MLSVTKKKNIIKNVGTYANDVLLLELLKGNVPLKVFPQKGILNWIVCLWLVLKIHNKLRLN